MAHVDVTRPIMIIGAGIAGLAVAEGLADAGARNITVLERYPNVGGRVVTNRDGPQYEIGAGRIHDTHRRVHALIRRFGLHTIPIGPKMEWRSIHDNKPVNWLQDILALQTKSPSVLARHTVRELMPAAKRRDLLQFPYRAEVDLLRADLALESFRAEMGTGAGYVGIREGIDAITHNLARDLKARGVRILTRHRVQDVRRLPLPDEEGTETMFEIVGDKGKKAVAKPFRYTAPQVIIATCRCSLGAFSVLKGDPMLRHIQTSPLTRIYAQWPLEADGACWWSRMGLQKTVTDSPLRFVIPINPATGLIMISYTDGTDTDVWKGLEGAALQTEIMAHVQRLWPAETIPDPTWVRKHEWPSGCSYWVPGDYDVEAEMQRAMAPHEGVFVVGESIARHQAWIESALEVVEDFLETHVVRKNLRQEQKMPGRRHRSTRRLYHRGGISPFVLSDRGSVSFQGVKPDLLQQQALQQKLSQLPNLSQQQNIMTRQQQQPQQQNIMTRQQQQQQPQQQNIMTRQQQSAQLFRDLHNQIARRSSGTITTKRSGGAYKTRRRNITRRRMY